MSHSSNGNGAQSYAERNNRDSNVGEDRFVKYCEQAGVKVQRIGFDEKQGKVPNFFRLSETLRHLPDFIVTYDNKKTNQVETRIVAVKGTNKFKEEDYLRLDWFVERYHTAAAPLVFVFVIGWAAPKFLSPARVKELYEAAADTEAEWPSDHKRYRVLAL